MAAIFHQAVRLGGVTQRKDLINQRPHVAVGEQRPELLLQFGGDDRFLFHAARAQSRPSMRQPFGQHGHQI